MVDISNISPEQKLGYGALVSQFVRFHQTVPLALLLENRGTTGVRNIFAEVTYNSTSERTILLTQGADIRDFYESEGLYTEALRLYDFAHWGRVKGRGKRVITKKDDRFANTIYGFQSSINNFSRKAELKTLDKHSWIIPIEWDGLQPQRTKLIQPVIYASCFENTTISISAKIFADSFAEPISVEAEAIIEVDRREVTFAELIADWRSIPDST